MPAAPFDLATYLRRIGFTGELRADVDGYPVVELRTAAAIMQALREVFSLPVEALPGLNERLEKLLAAAAVQAGTGSAARS